ncbi:MAG: aldo/keto reductase [Candidatus Latescibacterota bacterium]
MKRRDFVKSAALSAAAAAAGCLSAGKSGIISPSPNRMKYSILGKTGLKVSRLGYGSHLSKSNLDDPVGRDRQIKYAVEMGINFFDIYDHGYKQFEPMSKSLAGHPETVLSLYMDSDEVEKRIDEVLKQFGRERIDLYRAISLEIPKIDQLLAMKDKGKIRGVGIVDHNEENIVQTIQKYGDALDYVIFPYNFVHNKATPNDKQNSWASFLRLAKKYNYGLVGMKPFCNEMLLNFAKENGYMGGSKDRGVSVPVAAIRYALSTGAIHVSLPAMNNIREIEENLQGVYQPKLTALEREILDEIDLLALQKKWAYLNRKPEYAWLVNWAQRGV